VLTGGSEACVTEEELSVADEIAGLGFVCDALARGVISDRDPEAPMAAASPLGRLVFGADRASACCFCLMSA